MTEEKPFVNFVKRVYGRYNDRKETSSIQQAILVAIADGCTHYQKNEYYPSDDTLMDKIHCDPKALWRNRKKLIDHHCLRIVGRSKYDTYIYAINFAPKGSKQYEEDPEKVVIGDLEETPEIPKKEGKRFPKRKARDSQKGIQTSIEHTIQHRTGKERFFLEAIQRQMGAGYEMRHEAQYLNAIHAGRNDSLCAQIEAYNPAGAKNPVAMMTGLLKRAIPKTVPLAVRPFVASALVREFEAFKKAASKIKEDPIDE